MSENIKAKLKENRKTILISATIFSLITSLLVQLFSRRVGQTPGVILGVILSFWIMSKTFEFGDKVLWNKTLEVKFFFTKIENIKKAILNFISYFALLFVFLGGLVLIQKYTTSPFFILLYIPLSFFYLNAFSHIFWLTYSEESSYLSNLKSAFKNLYQAKIIVLKFSSQYIKPMIQGVLAIFMLTVLINSFQLQELLALPENESGSLIAAVFSNQRSQFVQLTGTFIIMYYVLFVGSILYGDYFKKGR